jgi:hypothetical protein
MHLLRERGETLSKEEYSAVRVLLDSVSGTIHDYHSAKRRMFNGREFLRFMRDYKSTSAAFEGLRNIQNPEIQKLRDETGRAMVMGFFAYTPFFRWEITARFFFLAAPVFARLGWRRVRTHLVVLSSALSTAKAQAEEFGYA